MCRICRSLVLASQPSLEKNIFVCLCNQKSRTDNNYKLNTTTIL